VQRMRLSRPPKRGSDEHVSVDRNIGDSGFSLLQRSRRFHGHQVSPLNRVFADAALELGSLYSAAPAHLVEPFAGIASRFWTAIPRESPRSPGCPRLDSWRKALAGKVSNSLIGYQKYRDFRGQQELLTQAAQRCDHLSSVLYQQGGASYLQVLTNETNYF
jgi:hypothetical protein